MERTSRRRTKTDEIKMKDKTRKAPQLLLKRGKSPMKNSPAVQLSIAARKSRQLLNLSNNLYKTKENSTPSARASISISLCPSPFISQPPISSKAPRPTRRYYGYQDPNEGNQHSFSERDGIKKIPDS